MVRKVMKCKYISNNIRNRIYGNGIESDRERDR